VAAQPFTIYNKAKKKIGNATINLGTGNFRISLMTSASQATWSDLTLSVWAQVLTGEIASVANSYSTSGKALTSRVWTTIASAKSYSFDVADVIWTASGAPLTNIKGCVIWLSAAATAGRHLLCRASLTSSQFTLSTSNTLTIQFNSLGVFTMV
jgi:hypothetical protein